MTVGCSLCPLYSALLSSIWRCILYRLWHDNISIGGINFILYHIFIFMNDFCAFNFTFTFSFNFLVLQVFEHFVAVLCIILQMLRR